MPKEFEQLSKDGRFSGAVVVRGAKAVRFAKGYGMADPFAGRPFRADTPVDSGSLAKPVTAAAVLILAREGKLDLDAPIRRYVPAYPYEEGTVRQLLAHSAGLPVEQMLDPITGKTNEMLLAEMSERKLPPLFPAGSGFVYCNFCYTTLALLIERVSGKPYLQFVQERAGLPASVSIRPAKLSEWSDRADNPVMPGEYRFPTGETVSVVTKGNRVGVIRGGLTYLAFKIGAGIRYVPGLDVYVAGAGDGGLHWLSLYEEMVAVPNRQPSKG